MKTLLVMRHAKSSWQEAALPDEQRPLNKRGRANAPRMGRLLRETGLAPQFILSSTAVRARQTALAVAEACGFEGEIQFEASLYGAPAETFLELLSAVPTDAVVVLAVGHNPGVEALLAELTGEDEHLSTGSIARIDLDIARWADLTADTEGRLDTIWRPRELD